MIKVIQCGLGAMGRLMAGIALDKRDMHLCGAVCRRPGLHGTDLADALGDRRAAGAKIYPDLASAAAATGADAALIATGSFLRDEAPLLKQAISAGLNGVSIAEEMAYPKAADAELAASLDSLARAAGVTLLGTGINPGFVLDALILTLTGVCRRITKIYAERVNDLSPYGGAVMETQGIGLTPEAFEDGMANGTVVGHIGFPQSVRMMADALGLALDRVEEVREPIIAKVARQGAYITVPPGHVAGCRPVARGIAGGRVVIELVHPQQIEPGAEGRETWDRIVISGEPPIEMRTGPEIAGGVGTAAIAVNMLPLVVAAEPGLKTMIDLPLPRLAALKEGAVDA